MGVKIMLYSTSRDSALLEFLKFLDGTVAGAKLDLLNKKNNEDFEKEKNDEDVARVKDANTFKNEEVEKINRNKLVKKPKATMTMPSENHYVIAVDVPGYKGCELDVTFSEEQGFVVKADNTARGEFSYKSGTSIFKQPIDIKTISVKHEDGVVYCEFSYLTKSTVKEPLRFTF